MEVGRQTDGLRKKIEERYVHRNLVKMTRHWMKIMKRMENPKTGKTELFEKNVSTYKFICLPDIFPRKSHQQLKATMAFVGPNPTQHLSPPKSDPPVNQSPSPVLSVFVFVLDFCLLLTSQVWVCLVLHIYTRSSSSFTTWNTRVPPNWFPWVHSCLSKPFSTSLKYPSLVPHCSLGKIQTPHLGLQGPP